MKTKAGWPVLTANDINDSIDSITNFAFDDLTEELATARRRADDLESKLEVCSQTCDIYQAENERLEKENSELKAQIWVLKDSQLRTYDGLAQKADRHDRMEAALRAVVDAFEDTESVNAETKAFETLEAAREALATYP